MKTYGGVEVFLTTALDRDEWSVSRPGRFTPVKGAAGTHCRRGWMVSGADRHAVEYRKIFYPSQESKRCRRYADWAIVAA
jgi:hypothetical protein